MERRGSLERRLSSLVRQLDAAADGGDPVDPLGPPQQRDFIGACPSLPRPAELTCRGLPRLYRPAR